MKTDRAEQNIHATPPTPCPPLAIVGLGCLFPKADNVEAYWTNIKNGVDAIREIPEPRSVYWIDSLDMQPIWPE